MSILAIIFIFTLGAVVGSFLSAYTHRWPRGESVSYGRSYCPNCRKKIPWHDNIPLLSYFLLKGKCRNCRKKISLRYPLIEFFTGIVFTVIYYFLQNCSIYPLSAICGWQELLGGYALPFLLFTASALLAIFVIDFEEQLIPDRLAFLLFGTSFLLIVLSPTPDLYNRLLTGFSLAVFLLLLHLVTRGRGMGLGDVKLALFGGFFFNWPLALVWVYSSFVIGAAVGLLLIALDKAKFGKQIAFGPFLVISFFVTLFWGEQVRNGLMLPFM